MANVTLMEFLQNDPRPFRYYHRGQSDSTTSHELFEIAQVRTTYPWHQFNLQTIINQFGALLNNVRIANDAHPSTPPPRFAAEDCLREIISIYADRPVRRALARAFEHIAANPSSQWAGRTETTLGAGSSARLVGTFVPDRAMYDPNIEVSVNRLPGEIKPSWKLQSAWLAPNSRYRRAFLKRLAQLTFYMLQQGYRAQHSGARYGYVLTDKEIIAFRKEDAQHTISVAEPVQWAGPSDGKPRMTVVLALWYLGMLASHDTDWNLDAQQGDPTDSELIS
ncbi:hypothetical protein A9K55_003768 [Cordyceps militaris]|uniref:Uncharacterized protein n=1 Tax=Cordyceps militaris TaxID=73501 RepID=A0A2H4SLU5_CORMI|nr:hypothetical protein A9K55_003768 [Cordyceps militaris]